LIVTDGFEFYGGAIGKGIAPPYLYGRVLKTRRKNRDAESSEGEL
jgi:hypothetical protein